jgi:hypothetical protein
MLMALLIAGIVFLLAGLAGIALGIPVKEFSFGNTEILAGVIVACTGMIMVSLWISIRELKALARRVGSAVVPPMPRPPFSLPSALTDPSPYEGGLEDNGVLAGLDEVEPEPEPERSAPPAPLPRPWHEETASRGRGQTPLPEEEIPAIQPRRNLMFSSTSRRDRERAEGRIDEAEIADPTPVVAAPPPLPFKPVEVPQQPSNFEDAWPQPERASVMDAASHRGAARAPSAIAERRAAAAERAMPPTPRETLRETPKETPKETGQEGSPDVTILKSGVVDGMAYSLYSDGSIEAEMPEGMMRFASIDELRAHLDQRGG